MGKYYDVDLRVCDTAVFWVEVSGTEGEDAEVERVVGCGRGMGKE